MSVMIIEDSSINSAFDTVLNLAFDAPISWPSVSHEIDRLQAFNERGFDLNQPEKYQYRGVEYLARWCALFNLRNYTIRYRNHKEFYRATFKWYRAESKPVTRQDLAQAIRTMESLSYNICDYYDDRPQYKALLWLIKHLRGIMVDSSPEMMGTNWG